MEKDVSEMTISELNDALQEIYLSFPPASLILRAVDIHLERKRRINDLVQLPKNND